LTRSADYTIQGFLYQFNKTLLEILNSNNDSIITIEGIEDIDIESKSDIELVQCKYHESSKKFNLSAVYKPILQMLKHFYNNQDKKISYKLYCYFPSQTTEKLAITFDQLKEVINSENDSLSSLIEELRKYLTKGDGFIKEFITRFVIEFGNSYDELTKQNYTALKNNGFNDSDIETLIYPNAINEIASYAIKHNIDHRKLKKDDLINKLTSIKTTIISKWTRELKNFDKILQTKRKQLKVNLDKNSRLRYFIINDLSLDDFNDLIVTFISDYIEKYHFKAHLHNKTPLFCLDCSIDAFKDINLRLYKKDIKVNNGYIIDGHWDEKAFFREPIVNKNNKEFLIRLMHHSSNDIAVLNKYKCDDLFIIGDCNIEGLEQQDITIESLELNKIQQVKYVMGMSNVYE